MDQLCRILLALLLCFISAAATPSLSCGDEATRYHHCLFENYLSQLEKFEPFDQGEFLETVSTCFTRNGCSKPTIRLPSVSNTTGISDDISERESDKTESTKPDSVGNENEGIESNETVDSQKTAYAKLQVTVVKTMLNPDWFPNATDKVFTGLEEKCMNDSYHTVNMMVQACIQKSLPGFRFPMKGGLPAQLLYFDMTVRAYASPHRFFTWAAGLLHRLLRQPGICPTSTKAKIVESCLTKEFMQEQRDSFREMLLLEEAFAMLCNISASCFAQSPEQCRPKIKALGEIECQCSLRLLPTMTDMLAEDYSACFQANVSRSAVESALRSRIDQECQRQRRSTEMCLKTFDDLL
ncbi:hypothetical protein M514_10421 [Trichuris suis]|uniref:Chondroitin proteoglycan 4 domain-containing protein n=1 Tax=Trichuris suis TaxID=68888 RepID=A0A085LUR4_9BILA|nr:hypothetical protein M513_10421 [Trichuris suis]KFD59484.1 hypothetical protein M514_10421 [Trichuris suis]